MLPPTAGAPSFQYSWARCRIVGFLNKSAITSVRKNGRSLVKGIWPPLQVMRAVYAEQHVSVLIARIVNMHGRCSWRGVKVHLRSSLLQKNKHWGGGKVSGGRRSAGWNSSFCSGVRIMPQRGCNALKAVAANGARLRPLLIIHTTCHTPLYCPRLRAESQTQCYCFRIAVALPQSTI